MAFCPLWHSIISEALMWYPPKSNHYNTRLYFNQTILPHTQILSNANLQKKKKKKKRVGSVLFRQPRPNPRSSSPRRQRNRRRQGSQSETTTPGYRWVHFNVKIDDEDRHYKFQVMVSCHTSKAPGPRLNIKTVLSTYGDFHVKDKTAVRSSYL